MSYFFNINEFKKWMKHQDGPEGISGSRKIVGASVESKYDLDHLSQYAESEDEDILDILDEFIENGGTIVEVDGNWVNVQVESGSVFSVPKNQIKKS